ncbi:MAG: hypothetical protein ACOCPR_00570, partial [Guyparkeria sp.]
MAVDRLQSTRWGDRLASTLRSVFKLDPVLLFFVALIAMIGVVAGYSAAEQSDAWVERSIVRLG